MVLHLGMTHAHSDLEEVNGLLVSSVHLWVFEMEIAQLCR